MSDQTGRLHSAAHALAIPGEDVRCPNCHATLPQCDDSGCGQRRPRGWRTAWHSDAAHPFAGSDPDREAAGLTGHCSTCAEMGHILAHPGAPCVEVGCFEHQPPQDGDRSLWNIAAYVPAGRENEFAELLTRHGFDAYRMWREPSRFGAEAGGTR